MKRLMIILRNIWLVLLGLFLIGGTLMIIWSSVKPSSGITMNTGDSRGKLGKVNFEPIPRPKPPSNYTMDRDTEEKKKEQIEYQHKNLNKMVGMTFMAYPAKCSHFPFTTGEKGDRGFGVRSPEKFTIIEILSPNDFRKEFRIKIKFDSGQIGDIIESQGFLFGFMTSLRERVFPDFAECIEKIERACKD